MADNLTTTTQVDSAVGVFYDRVLLKRAQPELIHTKLADVKNIPSKSSDTIKFRRYSALSVAATPIDEGVTPPGQKLAKTDLTAKVSQYGDFVHITDIVDLTVEDAVLTVAAEELGIQMGKTLDQLTRDILIACASSSNCVSGTNANSPTEMTKGDIQDVVRTLIGNDAGMITSLNKASTGVGTTPGRPAYWALANSYLIKDIEGVTDFKSTSTYPNQSDVDMAEWGQTGNVRWLISSVGHIDTSQSPDLFKVPIIGKHAYAMTSIEAGNAKNIVKAYGSGGTVDPLDQRASSGWKVQFVARILNDNFMHILACTAKNAVDA